MFLSSNCHWVSIWLVLSKTSSIISLAVNNWLSNNFSFPSTNLKVTDGASAVFNNVCEITSYEYNKLRQGLTLGWCDERIKATYLWICLFEPLCLNLSKYFSCGSRSTIKCWWTRITIEQVSMRSTAQQRRGARRNNVTKNLRLNLIWIVFTYLNKCDDTSFVNLTGMVAFTLLGWCTLHLPDAAWAARGEKNKNARRTDRH